MGFHGLDIKRRYVKRSLSHMEDHPQENVRRPEVTYVTFSGYQMPLINTLTDIKASKTTFDI